jgi:predicted O-linked N-acetylglucosamine transferase (SPINDLY family)
VQASFVGFTGTMAAPHIDYIVADRTVIPEAHAAHYREKLAYLPDTYYPTDSKLKASPRVFTRAEAGLPEKGFVFCSFNNNYKITPQIFDVWMRLLREVPGSVLWLLEDNPDAAANLAHEAEARGVTANRLVFAPRMAPPDHLARHVLADLFLDTRPYNAHTTATDALWMGLPVLTCPGQTFASCVAASVLKAVGLPEMVVDNPARYEQTALILARAPQILAAVKAKLMENRTTFPLFDTARFTRNLEALYAAMHARHASDLPPVNLPAQQ